MLGAPPDYQSDQPPGWGGGLVLPPLLSGGAGMKKSEELLPPDWVLQTTPLWPLIVAVAEML